MNRPPLEMADIVRFAGESFLQRSQRWISWQHQKVLLAITRCRTAALGGHRDRCSGCGHTAVSYNSCRNRHCPKCQGNARQRWLQARERELLPTPYVHIVFTLPREVASLALQNKQVIYNLLFHASAETLLEIARDPRHLGAEIGFFSVLHTWNQRLQHHPHIHCVLAAGGLAPDHSHWISSHRSFFLPVKVLSRVFRGKFVAGLTTAFREGKLQFHGHLIPLAQPRIFASWLRLLFSHDWTVYAKRPFGGPGHALRYLGNYTHRVALSNHRLVALTNDDVIFRWRDSAHGNKKRLMTLPVDEFRAASCSIYSHAASSVSVASASLPTDNVLSCCRSASACFKGDRTYQLPPPPSHRANLTHPGSVPSVAPPCMSLSNSQQLNCCSVPRHQAQTPHEPTPSPSIPPRAHTHIHLLCLTSLKPRSRPTGSRFSAARNSLAGRFLPAKSTYSTL
jgi:hypothetical protein